MKYLDVFEDIKIPVDLASTQTYAVLAKRDGGKTYTTLKFEEQLCDAGLYFATLDPVGKHWALRAGPDGKPGGGKEDVWVLGGAHGDVPLDPESGALIADTVVDHPGRYILDVSTFDSDAQQDRFALAFGARLFRRKAKDPGWPITVILEEAESFIPQNPQAGQQKMLGAYGRMMRQGRNYGIGMWLVAQRAQALNKGVLSQAEVLVVKQMAAKRDRDQVKEWAEANGTPEQLKEMMDALASLEQNEAYVWSPSWLRVFKRTTIKRRTTYDASASVKGGERARNVELTPLDVDALGEKMKEVADKAIKDDPKLLQKKLDEVERDLRKALADVEDFEAAQDAVRELEEKVRELEARPPSVTSADLEPLRVLEDEFAAGIEELRMIRTVFMSGERAISPVPVIPGKTYEPQSQSAGDRAVEQLRKGEEERLKQERAQQRPSPGPRPRQALENANGSTELTSTERELLAAYVAAGTRVDPEELGVLTAKAVNAGPVRGAMNRLVDRGYVLDGTATSEAPAVDPMDITPRAIQERWRVRLRGNQLKVFELALSQYPRWVPPEEIGAALGKDPNAGPIRGSFNKVAALGVIAYDKQQGVRASDYLFQR